MATLPQQLPRNQLRGQDVATVCTRTCTENTTGNRGVAAVLCLDPSPNLLGMSIYSDYPVMHVLVDQAHRNKQTDTLDCQLASGLFYSLPVSPDYTSGAAATRTAQFRSNIWTPA